MKYLKCFWLMALLPLHLLAWQPAAEEKVVFFGDSITASGQYTVYLESFLRTRFPETKWAFINSGKSSETLSGLSEEDHPGRRRNAIERFVNDVALYGPTVIISCFGINDGIYHPFSQERFAAYTNGILSFIDRVKNETKATLVLCTPPTYDPLDPIEEDEDRDNYGYKEPYAGYDKVMAKYAEWICTISDPRVIVADVYGRLRTHLDARRKDNPNFRLQGDGIHPNETGHLLMSLAIIDALQLQGPLNEFILTSPSKKVAAKIPMPTDPRWDVKSLTLENFYTNYNRTTLKSAAVKSESIQVKVDGNSLTNITSTQLAKGLNIPASPAWPPAAKAAKLPSAINNLRKAGYQHYRARAHETPEEIKKLEAAVIELSRPEELLISLEPNNKPATK